MYPRAHGRLILSVSSIVTGSFMLSNAAADVGTYRRSVVAVDSVPGLAPETPSSHQFAKQRAGAILLIAKVLREYL
jgi:hypothetical protein